MAGLIALATRTSLLGGPVREERLVAIPASVLDITRGEAVDFAQIFFDANDIRAGCLRGLGGRITAMINSSTLPVHEVVHAGQLAHLNKAHLVDFSTMSLSERRKPQRAIGRYAGLGRSHNTKTIIMRVAMLSLFIIEVSTRALLLDNECRDKLRPPLIATQYGKFNSVVIDR